MSRIIRHPDYNSDTFDNDICLLQLSSAVTLTNYIVPVCLAASGSNFAAGTDVWVTGWGNVQFGGETHRCPPNSCVSVATEAPVAV